MTIWAAPVSGWEGLPNTSKFSCFYFLRDFSKVWKILP